MARLARGARGADRALALESVGTPERAWPTYRQFGYLAQRWPRARVTLVGATGVPLEGLLVAPVAGRAAAWLEDVLLGNTEDTLPQDARDLARAVARAADLTVSADGTLWVWVRVPIARVRRAVRLRVGADYADPFPQMGDLLLIGAARAPRQRLAVARVGRDARARRTGILSLI